MSNHPTNTAAAPPASSTTPDAAHRIDDVVLAPGVRVLRSQHGEDPAVLVRHGDRITRLHGDGVVDFVAALLQMSEHGVVPLGSMDSVSEAQAAAVTAMLERLADAQLIVESDTGAAVREASPTARALWARCGQQTSAATIDERLATRTVLVIGAHPLAARIAATLTRSGLSVGRATDLSTLDPTETPSDGWAAAIVVGSGEDDPLLDAWNEAALATRTPWWAVLPHDGRRATVGPFVIPTASACWHCFRLRRAANFPDRSVADELASASGISPDTLEVSTPGIELLQTGVLVEQVVDRIGLAELSGAAVPGAVSLVEVDGTGVSITGHRVLRVPRCPSCSPAAGRGLPQVWYHGSLSDNTATAADARDDADRAEVLR